MRRVPQLDPSHNPSSGSFIELFVIDSNKEVSSDGLCRGPYITHELFYKQLSPLFPTYIPYFLYLFHELHAYFMERKLFISY